MCELNASSTKLNAIPERLEAYVDLHGSTKQNQILLQYTPGPRGNAIILCSLVVMKLIATVISIAIEVLLVMALLLKFKQPYGLCTNAIT